MTGRHVAPYGSWASPISIEMTVAGSVTLREPRLDGEDVYWIEGRPAEGGRQVVVRWNERQGCRDATPPGFNARTMANEYGGGPYVVEQGSVYFSNMSDGRLYQQAADGSAARAISGPAPHRFADLLVDSGRRRLLAVLEDHSPVEQEAEPTHSLVALDLAVRAEQVPSVLAAGSDFYSSPRLSPDGTRLAWLCWNHPNMPWDGSELWLAELGRDGRLHDARQLAGGINESIVQPEWGPDGSLVFASDSSGWWNLYRLAADQLGAGARSRPQPLAEMEAEFAGPQWVFGMSWYGIADDGSIAAIAHRQGRDELWLIPADGAPEQIALPDTQLGSLRVGAGRLVYVGASPTEPAAIVLLDLAAGERRVLRRSSGIELDEAYISQAVPISYPTSEGETAHALFYPPTNPDFRAPPGELPPLVVMSHGGPTSSASSALSLEKQVFTSRGFAVVDVDYRGSTGYGRAYMRALDGRWGIADVEDCINAARHLAAEGQVDEARMAIRGGSAGGYTTLCALAFHDVFRAGASYFGVGDLETLARDTHKFESRYLDRLVAPYPEGAEIYRRRSPIYAVDRLSCSLIVLQGRDDKIVPVAQAEGLVAALRQQGLPHAYLCFDGEGHGFRQAANIQRALEAEVSFYAQVFGFQLADQIEPVALS